MRCRFTILLSIPFILLADTEPPPPWRETLEKASKLTEAGSEEAQGVLLKAAAQAKEVHDGGIALSQVWNALGLDHQRHGRHSEAEVFFRRVLTVYEANPAVPPHDKAAILHNLAITSRALGRRQEAESLHRSAIQIIEHNGGPEDRALVATLSSLGFLYVETGRMGEAEALFSRALRIGEKAFGPNHPDIAPALRGLASTLRLRGELAAARQTAARLFRIVEDAQGKESIQLAPALYELGQFEFEWGHIRTAAGYWQRALEIVQKVRAPDHPDALLLMIQLADVTRLERRYTEAEDLLLRVVRAAEEPPRPAVLAVSLHRLALVYVQRKEHGRAEPLLRRSLEITRREMGSTPALAMCASDLGRTLLALKRPEEAEAMIRSALAVAEQTNALQHPFFLRVLQEHVQILRKLNRKEEARAAAERLEALAASSTDSSGGYTIGIDDLLPRR